MLVHGERAATWSVIRDAGLEASPPAWRSGRSVVVPGEGQSQPRGWWGSAERDIAARCAPDRPLADEVADIAEWDDDRRRQTLEWFAQIWCADAALLSAEGVGRVEAAWESGQQNFVIADGYDRVAEHLARGLDVHLHAPVHRLRWAPGAVEAHSQLGVRIRARAAVVTVPPSVVAAGRMRLAPSPPAWKLDAAASIPVGPVMRVVVRLARAAPEGASVIVTGAHGGWWRVSEGSRVVLGWIGGPAAARVARDGASKELVLRVGRALGWLTRRGIEAVRVVDWGSDPWSLGGYSYPRVGALEAPATWAEPIADTLFFAGEATCGDRHPATVHGAIESGWRAADEVARALA